MAQADKGFRTRPEVEPVNGRWFKFSKEGDKVSGWYQGAGESSITNTETGEPQVIPSYRVVDEYGIITDFLGTAQLNVLMARIPLDAFVVVTYDGMIESRRGRNVKQFTVELEKGLKLLAEGE